MLIQKPRQGIIGKNVSRIDAEEKVCGQIQYVDDLLVPDCWHGVVVRAPAPSGLLQKLVFSPQFSWDSVCVVTPEDIPGDNLAHMMVRDMPFLADKVIRYAGEPVALIAAPSRELAYEAATHVHIEMDEQPSILTLDEVVKKHKNNDSSLEELSAKIISKGDVEKGLASADKIIEGEYWCGHQEQLYIETQGIIAIPHKDGSLTIEGSMQCPYFINPELCPTLNIPPEKLRVRQNAVGGAFGGKEEFPTLLAGYCALLALKCGKPVKIVYGRHEDMLYTTKRHPGWIKHRTGLNSEGSITAMYVEYVLDGGAYGTISPIVMYRGILHAAMGYTCDNVFIDGKVYRTNTFPNGAFRGFGAPQAYWGLESHMDELAEACGLAPDEFRLKNCLRQGGITPTGQKLDHSTGSPAVYENTLKRSKFSKKFPQGTRGKSEVKTWKGIGLSFFAHGSGFTGDGEARFKPKVALELDFLENGSPGILIRVSSTEMGQGSFTALTQITAERLNLDNLYIQYPFPDTKWVPDSGPTVASRTTMVVGNALWGAAGKMRKKLESFASEQFFEGRPVQLQQKEFILEWDHDTRRSFVDVASLYLKRHGKQKVVNQFILSEDITWDQETFKGDAYPTYSWGCNVAEVEIDSLTLEIKINKITACYDIGRVINPALARGQIEGGLIQCLGYSLMEKIQIQKNGLYDASRMQNYLVPTTMDIPEIDLEFLEFPYELAPPGAKGAGEIPMDGLAPAIANAIKNAMGLRLRRLPITPETLLEAMSE